MTTEKYAIHKNGTIDVSTTHLNCYNSLQKIIMSDEIHLHLGGYVNKQNCRFWGSENPKMIIEKPLYPQRVTVWYGF